jgi:nucleotide-binding universal stress UspA family protein
MIAVKRILVPTDFSEASDAALNYGIGLAQAFGAQLYLLHVPGETGVNFEADFPMIQFENAVRERLDTLVGPREIVKLRPEYALRLLAVSARVSRKPVISSGPDGPYAAALNVATN